MWQWHVIMFDVPLDCHIIIDDATSAKIPKNLVVVENPESCETK